MAIAAIGGSGIGEALWRSSSRQNADSTPNGWQKQESKTPYPLADLKGELTLNPNEWALDFYRGISPATSIQTLGVTARLPEDGQLELWLSSPPDRKKTQMQNCGNGSRDRRCKQKTGAGIIIDNLDSPRARAMAYTRKGQKEVIVRHHSPRLLQTPMNSNSPISTVSSASL